MLSKFRRQGFLGSDMEGGFGEIEAVYCKVMG